MDQELNLPAGFWRKVNRNGPEKSPELGPCWLWTGHLDRDGYGRYWAKEDGTWRKVNAHRHAFEKSIGRALHTGMKACHRCDVPACVNPSHIWEGTDLENARDSALKSRRFCPVGEKNPRRKLSEQDARAILSGVGRYKDLAARFSVSVSTVAMIKTGKKWAHLQGQAGIG
jgi:hypothetical protein